MFSDATLGMSAEHVLTEGDVVALLNLVHNFSDKWHEIGLELGFAPSELNQISSNPSLFMATPASFLIQLLSQWVQWLIVNHPTKPTLGALCETLRSSLVGLGSLALEVEREIKCSTTGKGSFATHRIAGNIGGHQIWWFAPKPVLADLNLAVWYM